MFPFDKPPTMTTVSTANVRDLIFENCSSFLNETNKFKKRILAFRFSTDIVHRARIHSNT